MDNILLCYNAESSKLSANVYNENMAIFYEDNAEISCHNATWNITKVLNSLNQVRLPISMQCNVFIQSLNYPNFNEQTSGDCTF